MEPPAIADKQGADMPPRMKGRRDHRSEPRRTAAIVEESAARRGDG
jgi:hypothetical protein